MHNAVHVPEIYIVQKALHLFVVTLDGSIVADFWPLIYYIESRYRAGLEKWLFWMLIFGFPKKNKRHPRGFTR